ncbi:MAG: MFS transporter [Acidobacteria bacterium]|jgi:UMF1 family MFS transporter|nr:MFS transporter [Acidobacteriota bacterium]MBQ02203.1 MFS transporter [Acidobacteriota bacterium]MDP7478111.1 MFS transporter [Vicinamibacterales bacterium]MDP7691125.1 MFS transporter [Vicinamibacterales bacterium]HJN44082.1 MFS transporter [Vicinamibacterales bacterium]|tara:strand:- start:4776 stop:6104 length:1329 start_codon:yes stop_codon:yes gene_type:complete
MSAPSLLERVGLHRPELRAWAMYDWANSAFMATVVTAVFPIYFPLVAAAELDPAVASFRFASTTFIALSIVAVLAPVLGAIADVAAVKKKMLAVCLALGVVATACMFFIGRGDWMLAAVLFILANIGATTSFVFYDSLLPHIASTDEMDRVSTSGYALGYLGGGVLLVVNLAWILAPERFGLDGQEMAMRLSFVSVAVWWVGFSIPLFRTVPEPARALEVDEQASANPIPTALVRLGETLRELRGYKQAFLMMLAFLVYNDGIGTIIRMATTFGTEIGLEQGDLITAIMLVQFVGVPFAFIFGQIAGRLGAKRAIFLSLAVYVGISIFAYGMTTAAEFYTLAMLVGMVQGGSQALSRSLFASMVPRHKSSEFFGFFGVFEKFAGIVGPGVFAVMILVTGSSRGAILSIIAFFVIGGLLLARVDVEEGQRVARDAEADLRAGR